jgi:hypothetical protein
MSADLLIQFFHRQLAAHETRCLYRQVARHHVQRPQRPELILQPGGAHLEWILHPGKVAQPVLAPIDQVDAGFVTRAANPTMALSAL